MEIMFDWNTGTGGAQCSNRVQLTKDDIAQAEWIFTSVAILFDKEVPITPKDGPDCVVHMIPHLIITTRDGRLALAVISLTANILRSIHHSLLWATIPT